MLVKRFEAKMSDGHPQTKEQYKYEPVAKSDEAYDDGSVKITVQKVPLEKSSRAFLYIAACTGKVFH